METPSLLGLQKSPTRDPIYSWPSPATSKFAPQTTLASALVSMACSKFKFKLLFIVTYSREDT